MRLQPGREVQVISYSRLYDPNHHCLYELGFSDRVVSQDLAASLKLVATHKKDLVKALKQNPDGANAMMKKHPSYFLESMNVLLQ